MSSHTHRHRQYSTQQMLSSYPRGMTVGNLSLWAMRLLLVQGI